LRPTITQVQQSRSIAGKIVLALTVASVMVGISMGPALSEDNDRRPGPQERAQHAYQPAHRAHQPARHSHQPYQRAHQSYGYYAPPPGYYAPPPVIYVPPPSPGISLFFGFPIQIH
jgi:hypothetical protein